MKMHADTHLDHGLTQQQIDYLFGFFEHRAGFFVQTIILPDALGTVPCALHLDVPESEAHYVHRGERTYESRVCERAPYQTNVVTVVAGPADDNDPTVYLFTAYGGPEAPQEPSDPKCRDVEKSRAFWSKAALSVEKI